MAFNRNNPMNNRYRWTNRGARDPLQSNYTSNLLNHFSKDYEKRREEDHITTLGADLKILTVLKTEFYIQENAKSHHTDEFELVRDEAKTPVLRRGQHFFMAVRFSSEVDMNRDIIRLVFNFGPKPSATKGTKAIIQLTEDDRLDKDNWGAKINGDPGEIVSLQVNIPANSPVGLWKLNIQTGSTGTKSYKNFKCKEDVYILFNPWVIEDGVFMEDEAERTEYVLNDTGKIWMGSFLKPTGRRWFYGQFDDVVLPVAIHLLEKSGLKHEERGNPIQMARAISAVINSEDEDGLIEGKWSGGFEDGISPFAWTGSIAIMEKYLQNSGKPVKYGQCWVFSGAAVSVCRALGIPARPVTNYASAHDTNSSLTLDKYFTRDGSEIEGGPDGDCYDSCWNFHVWVDVWMKRPDLPAEYSGWQIIDPTPQELSDNAYKCGPASMEAIRKGEVGYLYDTPFAFAAVNADIFHFQEDEDSCWGFSRLNFDESHVGKKLITKKVGVDDDDETSCNDVEDVTNQYKNPEGSDIERLAVLNAIRGITKARIQYNLPLPHEEDVVFRLKEIDSIPLGQPFRVVVTVENVSDEPRTVQATMAANSVFYTGITAHVLKKAVGKMMLKPKQKEVMHISVIANDYLDKLVDHHLVKIYAIATVKETKQSWSKEDDFPLSRPPIEISVSGILKVGSECNAAFSFTNPINRRLTSCQISLEGPGLQRPKMKERVQRRRTEREGDFRRNFHPQTGGSEKNHGDFQQQIFDRNYRVYHHHDRRVVASRQQR